MTQQDKDRAAFEAAWAKTGYQYGSGPLANVRLGWDLAIAYDQQQRGEVVIPVWRSMDADPPKTTGRYCVGHRGKVFGDAYYTAMQGDTHYPVGWAQVPNFSPTHWLDAPYIGDAAPQPAEPVKGEPTDEEIETLKRMRDDYNPSNGPMSTLKAKALDAAIQSLTVARYQGAQPAALSALRELVRLKDIKDRMDRSQTVTAMEVADYKANKERAWEAARAVVAAPVAAQSMVDMVPPATSRDRWMYEQGRLAERDPRTEGSLAAQIAAQPSVPAGLPEILKEAAAIIGAIHPEFRPPTMRQPLVDELKGFAAMLTSKGSNHEQN